MDREARSTAVQAQELKFMSERHELAMATITRFTEILDKLFEKEDEQFKAAMAHGLRAATMQMEQELRGCFRSSEGQASRLSMS